MPSATSNDQADAPRPGEGAWGGEAPSPKRIAAGLLFLLFCAAAFFRHVDTALFVGDESSWVTASHRHAETLLQGDLRPSAWEFPDCGPYGNLNPQLGKLMLGVPLLLYTKHKLDEAPFDRHYDWHLDRLQNLAAGNIPPDSQLRAARTMHAACGLLAFAAGYLFVWYCCGLLPAVLAGAFLLFNERYMLTMSRAMMDAPFHLFTMLGLLCIAGYLSAKTPRAAWMAAGLTGIAAGLAASVKITGIVVVGLFLLPFLFLKHPYRRGWKPVLAHGMTYSIAAVFTVYLLNPFFWPEFPTVEDDRGFAAELRTAWESRPLLTFPDDPEATLGDRLTHYTFDRDRVREVYPRLYGMLRPLEFPLLFARWNTLLDEQQATFPVPPPTATGLHRRLFLEFATFPGNLVLVMIGLVVCGRRAVSVWQRGNLALFALPLVFALISYGFWFATMRIELSRYYVAPLIGVQVLAGIAAAVLLQWAMSRAGRIFRHREEAPPPSA